MSTWTDNVTKLPWHWRGTLVSADGNTTLNLTDDDFLQNSIKIEESCSDTDKFTLGGVITSSCSCTLIDIDQKFGGFDFTDAKLTLEVGLVYEDETEEWHTRGVFYCDKPSIVSEMIELTAYDAMDKFNRLWGNGEGGNIMSSDVLGAVSILAYECGVTFTQPDDWYLPNPALPNGNIEFAPQTTYRQLLSWLVEFSHGYAIIENDRLICKFIDDSNVADFRFTVAINGGQMWFGADTVNGGTIDPWSSPSTYDGNTEAEAFAPIIFNSRISSEQIGYEGIVIYPYDDVEHPHQRGTVGGYSLYVKENPLITASNAVAVGGRLYDNELAYGRVLTVPGFDRLSFRPFEASVWCDPMVRCGEWVQISDINGNLYYAPITSMTIHGDGEIELACHAQTYAENKAELTEEKYSTVQDAVDQANTYTDDAVTQASIDANAYADSLVADKPSWFTIYQGTTAQITVESQATTSATTITFTVPEGYQAIGICGWNTSARACVIAMAHISAINGRSVSVQFALYNAYTSARTTTVKFDILCVKTT